jgi:hypothetical protein
MVGVLTTAVYPYLSPALEQREPGHGYALLALGGRNLVLVGWYCAFFFRALAPIKLARSSFAQRHRLSAAASSQHGNV